MTHVKILSTSVVALAISALAVWWAAPATAQEAGLMRSDAQTIALGQQVYASQCAACHGANLEGAPNWRERGADGLAPAPPHDETGHTWHHDSAALFAITKYGVAKIIGDPNYRSGMPSFEDALSDDEIVAVLSYVRSTWPDRFGDMYDAREAQQ